MWEYLDENEVCRRLDALQKYCDVGVPDPGNALAYYWFTHGEPSRARDIWTQFAIESEEPGRFKFLHGREHREGYGYSLSSGARHPLTPPTDLALFVEDEDPEIPAEVGLNPAASEDLIRQVANGLDPNLDFLLNPACPPDLLRLNMWVRIENDDEYPSVTWGAISGNPSCPLEVIEGYLESEEDWDEDEEEESLDELMENMMNPLAQNISLPMETCHRLAGHWHPAVRRGIAANPITPADILAELASDPDDSVRSSVARNLMIPDGVHSIFESDDNVNVRAAIAGNPSCPVELLESLSLDPDERGIVQKAVLGNPSSSERARTQAALAAR